MVRWGVHQKRDLRSREGVDQLALRLLNRRAEAADPSSGQAEGVQRLPQSGTCRDQSYTPPHRRQGRLAGDELRCGGLGAGLPGMLQGQGDRPAGRPYPAHCGPGEAVQPCPSRPGGATSCGGGRLYLLADHGGPHHQVAGGRPAAHHGGGDMRRCLHCYLGHQVWSACLRDDRQGQAVLLIFYVTVSQQYGYITQ